MTSTGPQARTLLVTGVTGYLGSRVAARADALGWHVVGAARSGGDRRVDLADPAAGFALVADVTPDAVVHTAYAKDVPEMHDVIVDGSAAIAAGCAAIGSRLVHVSSDVVFAGDAGRPYDERDAPDPVSAYGEAKAAAERRVSDALAATVLVRTSLIIGGPHRQPSPHERAALDPDMTFWSDALRCPVQVDDLAAALIELVDTDVSGPLHVAGADALTRAELAEIVAGKPVRAAPAPPGVPRDLRLDCARARRLLRTELRGAYEVLARRSG